MKSTELVMPKESKFHAIEDLWNTLWNNVYMNTNVMDDDLCGHINNCLYLNNRKNNSINQIINDVHFNS